jgi:hypothetical protein
MIADILTGLRAIVTSCKMTGCLKDEGHTGQLSWVTSFISIALLVYGINNQLIAYHIISKAVQYVNKSNTT